MKGKYIFKTMKLETILCQWKKLHNLQYGNRREMTVSRRGNECWACHGYDKICSDYVESKEDGE